eukprot:941784-Prorocentrum_minimum.AAC.1
MDGRGGNGGRGGKVLYLPLRLDGREEVLALFERQGADHHELVHAAVLLDGSDFREGAGVAEAYVCVGVHAALSRLRILHLRARRRRQLRGRLRGGYAAPSPHAIGPIRGYMPPPLMPLVRPAGICPLPSRHRSDPRRPS